MLENTNTKYFLDIRTLYKKAYVVKPSQIIWLQINLSILMALKMWPSIYSQIEAAGYSRWWNWWSDDQVQFWWLTMKMVGSCIPSKSCIPVVVKSIFPPFIYISVTHRCIFGAFKISQPVVLCLWKQSKTNWGLENGWWLMAYAAHAVSMCCVSLSSDPNTRYTEHIRH